MRLYVDEDLASAELISRLRRAGHEVLEPVRGEPDRECWRHAQDRSATVITLNARDFAALAEGQEDHKGLLLVYRENDPRRDLTFGAIAAAVDRVAEAWITGGELLAIQPPPHGNYKIPAQALVVFKQRAGLLPTEELRLPEAGPSREYRSAQEVFDELIAPRLRAVGATSVPELLSTAESNPDLARLARELLPVYDLYLKELAASPALAATR